MRAVPWITRGILPAALAVAAAGPIAASDAIAEGRQALARCTAAVESRSELEAAAEASRAEEAFAAALVADPQALAARLGIARTLMQCRIEAAPMMEKVALMQRIEQELAAVLAAAPDDWEAHLLYGTLLYHVPPFLGRTADAAGHLEALVALHEAGRGPASPEPYLMLGDLYVRLGRPEDAADVWRRGRRCCPPAEPFDERLGGAPPETASPAVPERDGAPAGEADRLRERFEREVGRPEVPGLAVAVARGDEVLVLGGFGIADLESGAAMTADSVVRIGSVTKQLTAVAILRTAEEGPLALGDPLARWLRGVPAAVTEGIYLRHLLTHTSGLPRDVVEGADWVAASLAAPRVGSPGERYVYSNLGYALLGRVLEAATSTPFEAAMHRLVLEPAGLGATAPCDDRAIVSGRAQGYTWMGDRLFNDDPLAPGAALQAAGGLCSTARDLLAWQRAVHGGSLLSPEEYRELLAVPAVEDPGGTSYAAGVRVHAPRGRRLVHHAGGTSGFLSEVAYYPDERLAVVIVANSEAADPRGLAFEVAELLLGPAPQVSSSPRARR